jgi:hypothetical protein
MKHRRRELKVRGFDVPSQWLTVLHRRSYTNCPTRTVSDFGAITPGKYVRTRCTSEGSDRRGSGPTGEPNRRTPGAIWFISCPEGRVASPRTSAEPSATQATVLTGVQRVVATAAASGARSPVDARAPGASDQPHHRGGCECLALVDLLPHRYRLVTHEIQTPFQTVHADFPHTAYR